MMVLMKNIALKCFLLLMALQILNLGIDAIDFQPIASANTIGDFNYINSMTEYFAEVVMGNKDAFPEYERGSASSKPQIIKHFSLQLYQPVSLSITGESVSYKAPVPLLLNEKYKYLFFKEINPPPPKA